MFQNHLLVNKKHTNLVYLLMIIIILSVVSDKNKHILMPETKVRKSHY